MDLEKFIQNNTPKKKISIFDEYVDDINKLLELNYSQKQVIEYLKSKCKSKAGLSEQNLSSYLKKSKNKITKKDKNINIDKYKDLTKDNSEKKPIDIFANLKTKESKTHLEQTMLDFVKEIKN